jgi:hypothetical protein
MRTIRLLGVAALALGLGGLGAPAARADDKCIYRGAMFSHGATACQAGVQFRCDDGEWEKTDDACVEQPLAAARPCQFGGISYSTGAASCQAGAQYRCEDGAWRSTGDTCPIADAPPRAAEQGETCMYEGATVAHRSAICRAGSTFFCNDGQWVNLGTACR